MSVKVETTRKTTHIYFSSFLPSDHPFASNPCFFLSSSFYFLFPSYFFLSFHLKEINDEASSPDGKRERERERDWWLDDPPSLPLSLSLFQVGFQIVNRGEENPHSRERQTVYVQPYFALLSFLRSYIRFSFRFVLNILFLKGFAPLTASWFYTFTVRNL